MNDKTITEFGFIIIWRIMEISEGVIRLGLRTASEDKTLGELHNSSDDTKAEFNSC